MSQGNTFKNEKVMKRIIFFLATLLISFLSLAQRKSSSDVYVNAYTRSNGTYVQPHYRTARNLAIPNFSDKGMVNPYNGKIGTVIPKNTVVNNSATNFYSESKVSDYTEIHVNQIHKDEFSSDNTKKYTTQYNNSIIEVFSCSSIYDSPKGTGNQIEQACKGKVTLLSQYNEKYCKVKYENIIGFMEVRWIKLPSTNSNNYDTNTFAPKIVEVFTCSAIYDKPEISIGKIINQACDGRVVILSQFNEKYYKVKYQATIGYLEVRLIK